MDPSLSAPPFTNRRPPATVLTRPSRSLAPRHFVLDIPSVFRILFPSQPAFVSRRRGLASADEPLKAAHTNAPLAYHRSPPWVS